MSVLLIIGLGLAVWIVSCLCVIAVCASAKEGDRDWAIPAAGSVAGARRWRFRRGSRRTPGSAPAPNADALS